MTTSNRSRTPATIFDLVTIDAVDSTRLAAFWAEAIGLSVVESEDNDRWIVLGSSSQARVLGIQRVENLSHALGDWQGPTKARVHLDLACPPTSFPMEVERLLSLGATRVRDDRIEAYGSIATLADPEGNLFDLCAYY